MRHCIHTYIIGHYNPSLLTYFLTPFMLCVLILYRSGGTYSLKSILNDRFLRKFSRQFYFTLRVFAKSLLRGNRWRNTFRILFWCLACGSNLLEHTTYLLPQYLYTFLEWKFNVFTTFNSDPWICGNYKGWGSSSSLRQTTILEKTLVSCFT